MPNSNIANHNFLAQDDLTDAAPNVGYYIGKVAIPSGITFTADAAATIPIKVVGATSQTGNLLEFRSSTGVLLASVTSAGNLTTANGYLRAATVVASTAINTVETVITPAMALLAGLTLRVGSVVRVTIHGTNTSSAANVTTFTLRAGTLGTASDASVATAAVTSATSGTGVAFEIVIQFTVQTLGSAGTCFGSMRVTNTGVTGIAAVTNTVVPFTSSTLATTTATFFEVTHTSAASTTTSTFQDVVVEVLA